MLKFMVVTALGEDRPGIVNELSKVVLDTGCNILESRMSVLGGEFAVILMVSGQWNNVAKLESSLPPLQQKCKLTIVAKQTEPQAIAADLMPYSVEVVAIDHPGIVHNLSQYFSSRNINIADLATSTYAAPHTGAQMFALQMTVNIPRETHISTLREEFLDYCDELNLDAVMEPVKG